MTRRVHLDEHALLGHETRLETSFRRSGLRCARVIHRTETMIARGFSTARGWSRTRRQGSPVWSIHCSAITEC